MQIYGEFEDFRNQTVHEVWVGFISMTPVIWSSLISAVIKPWLGGIIQGIIPARIVLAIAIKLYFVVQKNKW